MVEKETFLLILELKFKGQYKKSCSENKLKEKNDDDKMIPFYIVKF